MFGPQGNLRISVRDLGKVMRMLMAGGVHEGRRILAQRTVDEMLAPQWGFDGGNGAIDDGWHQGRYRAWGLGTQLFLDHGGPGAGDRLVAGGGFLAAGHLGGAYGLNAVFAFNRARRDGMIVVIGGTAFDPATYPGEYSAFGRHEERILTALYRWAIAGLGRTNANAQPR